MIKLLFIGEIYPNTINGIAISNEINLTSLKKIISVDTIEEDNIFIEHTKFSIRKLINTLTRIRLIISKSIVNRYDYFYLVF